MKFKDHIRNMFAVYCREFKMVTHDVGIILFFYVPSAGVSHHLFPDI